MNIWVTTVRLQICRRERGQYLGSLTKTNPDEDEALSRYVWYHALAIIYTPLYRSEHVSAVRANWPRIPLPATLAALEQSAQVGIKAGQASRHGRPRPGSHHRQATGKS